MDTTLILLIILIVASFATLVAIVYVSTRIISDIASYREYDARRLRFHKLLVNLMKSNPNKRDIIDLYKNVTKTHERSPTFLRKIESVLIDFKASLLASDSTLLGEDIDPKNSIEWREKINQIITEIKKDYPFAGVDSSMVLFFEESMEFIEKGEKEAIKSKIVELSKIFAKQFRELNQMKKKTEYSYYYTIIGVVIGVCSLLFAIIK